MESVVAVPNIPESVLEYRQSFTHSWVDQWNVPNPFITPISDSLKDLGVGLTDFSFNKDATNLGEILLTVVIRKLNATVRIGLDSVLFTIINPDWQTASKQTASTLISNFERVTQIIHKVARASPAVQEATLALHVVSETTDLKAATAALVKQELLGDAEFYGISLHRDAGTVLIEKSVRYDHAAFVRLQRRFSQNESIVQIASVLYEDAGFALGLLGLVQNPEG